MTEKEIEMREVLVARKFDAVPDKDVEGDAVFDADSVGRVEREGDADDEVVTEETLEAVAHPLNVVVTDVDALRLIRAVVDMVEDGEGVDVPEIVDD